MLWCLCVCLSALSPPQLFAGWLNGHNSHSVSEHSDFHNGGRQYKLMTNTIISVVQIDPIPWNPASVRVLSTLNSSSKFSNIIMFRVIVVGFTSLGCRDSVTFSSSFFLVFFGEKSKT